MKIVFISNYFNHHQKHISDALFRLTDGNYYFISISKISEERIKLGYSTDGAPEYVKYNYGSEAKMRECQRLIDEADVAIWGSAPYSLLETRLKNKKLTFAYSERLFKQKKSWWKLPLYALRNIKRYAWHKNYFLLCASAFAAADYAKTLAFCGKAYKWGYFPEFIDYPDVESVIEAKKPNSIMWCARFIDWKHPEIPVEIAKRLRADGYDFTLNMIGNGELLEKTRRSITDAGLEDCVFAPGAVKASEVRRYMEESEIFLFTSDRNEGWGAVLNESMNSACAVVANGAIGAVPFLVKNGENGFIYKDGDIDGIYRKVKSLLDDRDERIELSKNAYLTVKNEWNAENAAKKFIALCEKMLAGEYKPFPYENGVCSKAEILKDFK